MFAKYGRKIFILLFLTVLVSFLPFNSCYGEVLSKKGKIAVVLRGSGSLRKADAIAAGSVVIRELVQRGYRVVDKNRLEAMKRSEAARLAFEGDADALINLWKKYQVRYYVKGTAEGHRPVVNEFGLYTATVTIALQAYRASDGKYLFSDSIVGKEVGYTAQEASSNALLMAAEKMAEALGEGKKISHSTHKKTGKRYSLSVSGLSGLVAADGFRQDLESMPGVVSASLGSGIGTISVQVVYDGTVDDLAEELQRTFDGLVVESRKSSSLSVYVD